VGVTAGTSTPDTLIEQVEQWLTARSKQFRTASALQTIFA
jgi:4-hydroxy-3-methylbut-2-enyl diphosphate reductase IspH